MMMETSSELLAQNPNLNHLIEPSAQGVNRNFVLAFQDDAQRISKRRHYIPNIEIKDYNVMIDGKNFFDQPVKNDKGTYFYRSRGCVCNWLFIRLYLFQKIL